MKYRLLLACLLAGISTAYCQELYVFTEPASNIPAHALSVRLTDHVVTRDRIYDRTVQRFMPQLLLGLSKKLMVNAGATFANMHTTSFRYESVNLYTKYRFLSKDGLHRHFRMAAFIDGSITKAPFHYEEATLMGDKSGIEAGIVATQLSNKLAVSASVSHLQVLDKSRNNKVIYIPTRSYQAMNYTLSGGYLLFPKSYTNYRQTNLNLYTEFLAGQSIDLGRYYIDLAPALQLIFNSNAKLNIGYRVQIAGDMDRMTRNSWLISFERTFLNALKK